jgi:tetratricopeptide (TPR) repeat protein
MVVLSATFAAAEGADPATKALERAESCEKKGDYDGALAACDEAIRLNPKLADAYFQRGVVLEVSPVHVNDEGRSKEFRARDGGLYRGDPVESEIGGRVFRPRRHLQLSG